MDKTLEQEFTEVKIKYMLGRVTEYLRHVAKDTCDKNNKLSFDLIQDKIDYLISNMITSTLKKGEFRTLYNEADSYMVELEKSL